MHLGIHATRKRMCSGEWGMVSWWNSHQVTLSQLRPSEISQGDNTRVFKELHSERLTRIGSDPQATRRNQLENHFTYYNLQWSSTSIQGKVPNPHFLPEPTGSSGPRLVRPSASPGPTGQRCPQAYQTNLVCTPGAHNWNRCPQARQRQASLPQTSSLSPGDQCRHAHGKLTGTHRTGPQRTKHASAQQVPLHEVKKNFFGSSSPVANGDKSLKIW